ncbi:unnamed protein product [Rotaria magnacalcarata]|uniref:Uncharacterized protein n=2 Tax=Rotaria magnacalcarata TaxID=392030 RepID=A0A816RQW9_9BILA|nr:unnamed protein product [Rotaria magnacalcarata]
MISNLHLIFLVTLCFTTMTHGFRRHRRQLNQQKQNIFFPNQRTSWTSNPSGSFMGSYYYGVGSDPNYGSFIQPQNRPDVGILPISYDPDSSYSSYLINSNQPSLPQQSQQQYLGNNNNPWQRPNINSYNNKPDNSYPSGSQGWYATGNNYWQNNGQCLIQQSYILLLSILILIVCK